MSLETLQASIPIRDVDPMPAQDGYPIGRRSVPLDGGAIRTRSDTAGMPRHRRDRDAPCAITPAPHSAVAPSPRGACSSG